MESSTAGRHTQQKQTNTSANSITSNNNPLVRKSWTAKKDTKKLFLLVNKLTGNTAQNPLPPNKTDEELNEDFARFFLSKIEKTRESFINTPAYKATHLDIPKFPSFCPLMESEVSAVIMKMRNKHCELDIIPISTLKQILDACLPVITEIVNLSLTNGQMESLVRTGRLLLSNPDSENLVSI